VAGVEDEYLVGERGDLGRLVRDIEDRQGEGRLDLQEMLEDSLLEGTVEAGKGLVEEQNLRCREQGPAEGDAAPLAAGKRRGASLEERGESEGLDDAILPERGFARDAAARSVTQIARDGKMREQRIVLRDVSDGALAWRDADSRGRVVEHAAGQDDASPLRMPQARDDLEERRLAGARRAEDGRNVGAQRDVELEGEGRERQAEAFE
jgi:hypothetical protein